MNNITRRICKKCGEIKQLSEFTKTKNKTHIAYRYTCRDCEKLQRKENNKKYYEKRKKKKEESKKDE